MLARKKPLTEAHLYLMVGALMVTVLGLSVTLLRVHEAAIASDIRSAQQLTPKQCDSSGSPIINVTQKVTNDADSGEAGNYWAFDEINRHIQVWKQSGNTFCAVVDYEGKFDAQAGQKSPGNTGVLTGNEDGTLKGGYRAVITGALIGGDGGTTNAATKNTTAFPRKGNLGSFDYKCDLSGNCPGAVSWIEKYFGPEYTFDYSWWGWEYRNKTNVWINASTGNSGDVL